MCLFVRPSTVAAWTLLDSPGPFPACMNTLCLDHFLMFGCACEQAHTRHYPWTDSPAIIPSLCARQAKCGRRQRPKSVPQLNPETEYIHHKAVDQICHMLSCSLAKQRQPCMVETASALRPENKGQAEKCPDLIPPSLLAPTLFCGSRETQREIGDS